MYYIENYNPPIITKEIFQAVQELMKKRSTGKRTVTVYTLSTLLKCPECGRTFRRQVIEGKAYWCCAKFAANIGCHSRRVKENMVYDTFMNMVYRLKTYRKEIIESLIQRIEYMQNKTSECHDRIRQIDKEIADLSAKNLVITRLHSSGILGVSEYTAQSSEISNKISELRIERRKKLTEDENDVMLDALKNLNEIIEGYQPNGKVDMIIVKSISRFARNTVDCLQHTRMLKALGVDVYFEEQGIHSTAPGAEFYITIYGSIAQSESENISANVRWGKAQSAKEGNVPFQYKRFLGYRKGADGKPEIDPEEAEIVKLIYTLFLSGDSLGVIVAKLNEKGLKTPSGTGKWTHSTVQSILSNERYKGDAILNKTYIEDCISKKVKINNGERPKYYVENNHPAIIDAVTFARVQEELARRTSKPKVKQQGTKTEQGRYSSKYALTELLVCGECKTPYRRCTWTVKGTKKIVWRCISRLDFGKKYCKHSPTIEESVLHEAIMNAIMRTAQQNTGGQNVVKLFWASSSSPLFSLTPFHSRYLSR